MDYATALDVVYEAIAAANELRTADKQIPSIPDVRLTGADGALDSLGLATTMLAIERGIEDRTGQTVILLDEASTDVEEAMDLLATPDAVARLIVEKTAG